MTPDQHAALDLLRRRLGPVPAAALHALAAAFDALGQAEAAVVVRRWAAEATKATKAQPKERG